MGKKTAVKGRTNLDKILNNQVKVRAWYRSGLSIEDIALKLGVSKSSLYQYKASNEDVASMFVNDEETTKYLIEEALLKAADGRFETIDEPMKLRVKIRDSQTGRVVREEERIEYVKKQIYVPFNVTAIQYALNNLYSEKYSRDGGVGKADGESELLISKEAEEYFE